MSESVNRAITTGTIVGYAAYSVGKDTISATRRFFNNLGSYRSIDTKESPILGYSILLFLTKYLENKKNYLHTFSKNFNLLGINKEYTIPKVGFEYFDGFLHTWFYIKVESGTDPSNYQYIIYSSPICRSINSADSKISIMENEYTINFYNNISPNLIMLPRFLFNQTWQFAPSSGNNIPPPCVDTNKQNIVIQFVKENIQGRKTI